MYRTRYYDSCLEDCAYLAIKFKPLCKLPPDFDDFMASHGYVRTTRKALEKELGQLSWDYEGVCMEGMYYSY